MSIPGSILYRIYICNKSLQLDLLPNHLVLRLISYLIHQFMETFIP